VSIPNASWSASCGVPWSEAVSNNWLLKDANGKYVPIGTVLDEYLADIGNSSYRQRFISEMDADIRGYRGVDAELIDNLVGSVISISDKYRQRLVSTGHAWLHQIGRPGAEGKGLVRGKQCGDER
jgi:hypothetical protein